MNLKNIRNFSIIAHIDHGKSTLADRMLEITHTIEARKMRDQVLDKMDLERERGITIKMTPVRMEYHPRGIYADITQNNAEEFLYKDLTYKIRGVLFNVRKNIGLGHKEQVYHSALEIEFKKSGMIFESKKNIPILCDGRNIGIYQPDFVIEDKVLIELKALPEIGKPQIEQTWSYLKGCSYKLALLVNFGSKDLEIKRIVYDSARISALSASSLCEPAGVSNYGERLSASFCVKSASVSGSINKDEDYTLNLIDTPGHIDFSYEVSRALQAVEGSILLVDATQGVQAQTLTTLGMARSLGLAIIPVVSKIDAPLADVPRVKTELAELLGVSEDTILLVSGRTGEGVEELLSAVVERVPPPQDSYHGDKDVRALVFDFEYSNHQGVILYVRVLDGVLRANTEYSFIQAKEKFTAAEVGMFNPEKKPVKEIVAGEIGYIVTGLKKPGIASVGDTVSLWRNPLPPITGYRQPKPVVWASLYPESQDDFDALKDALQKLKLSDSALTFEEETSGTLGRGFRCGFLGMLHLEIVTERLRREYGLALIVTTPSINYEVTLQSGEKKTIYSPHFFPNHGSYKEVREPWAKIRIITPPRYVGPVMQLLFEHEAEVGDSAIFGDERVSVSAELPLRELMRNFFDKLKSISSGFASLSYDIGEMRHAEVARLDVLVAGEPIAAFAKVVSVRRVREEAEAVVEKLHSVLPKQLFVVKIQGQALGRIISSRTLSALKKDVTVHLYGGDITRKMKLREKQKKGKKKMKTLGRVDIPQEVFLKVMKE